MPHYIVLYSSRSKSSRCGFGNTTPPAYTIQTTQHKKNCVAIELFSNDSRVKNRCTYTYSSALLSTSPYPALTQFFFCRHHFTNVEMKCRRRAVVSLPHTRAVGAPRSLRPNCGAIVCHPHGRRWARAHTAHTFQIPHLLL